jgi:hypothetical protein
LKTILFGILHTENDPISSIPSLLEFIVTVLIVVVKAVLLHHKYLERVEIRGLMGQNQFLILKNGVKSTFPLI